MIVSLFSSPNDPRPRQKEMSWSKLVEQLTTHIETTKPKLHLPLFSLAEFEPGTTRANKNVKCLHGLVLDIDGITEERWHEILTETTTAACWYTSYSHSPPIYKLRLILKIDRTVSGDEWRKLNVIFQQTHSIDPKTIDPARAYFGPFMPKGAKNHFSGTQEGPDFQVDLFLEKHKDLTTDFDVDFPPIPSVVVQRKELSGLIVSLRRKEDPKSQLASRFLTALRDGVPFTEEGHRDSTIFQYVIPEIVKKWPGIDTDKFIELIIPSLEKTGGVTPEQLAYKIEREKENRLAWLKTLEKERKQKKVASEEREKFRRELLGIEEDYKPDTLQDLNITTVTKNKTLTAKPGAVKIVKHGTDFYFWVDGTYRGPFGLSSVKTQAAQLLAPFPEIKKDIFTYAGRLQKDIDINQLILDHGYDVQEVIRVLGGRQTELSEGRLLLPYFPILPYDAAYSWKIDAWIRVLFGGALEPDLAGKERIELAHQWLYWYQDHSLPLPAIVLVGATGAGKTLFCRFLAYAYSHSGKWGDMADLFRQGTENNVHPIMVSDDVYPSCDSGELRQTISADQHNLKKKYANTVTVKGYVRHVITLNDADKIKTYDVGSEAQKATAERFFYVPVTDASSEFLRDLKVTKELLHPGDLQRHIAWMHENEPRTVDLSNRFTIDQPKYGQAFAESFYRQEGRFEVLDAICRFICASCVPNGIIEQYGGYPIEVKTNKEVWISPGRFYGYIEDKISKRSKSYIGRILKSIAEPRRTGMGRYWVLNNEHLFVWSALAMEYSDEQIRKALNEPTDRKVQRVEVLN